MIHLICDSTAAVPDEMLAAHSNLHVIPLTICIGGVYSKEDVTSIEAVIEYSEREKKAIPTSQPSTGDFIRIFSEIPEKDPIVVLTLTSGVSGTYNGAVLAARQSGRKNISVTDTRTTAIGMVQLLEDCFEWIDAGCTFEEVTANLRAAARRNHTAFTIATLDYLRRGGRVGKAAGLIGSILKIRPVIYINDQNEVDVLDKVRTEKKGVASLMKFLHEHSPCKRIGVIHITNPEGAEAMRAAVQEEYPDVEVTVSTGTPIHAAYLGPGLLGLIFESAE